MIILIINSIEVGKSCLTKQATEKKFEQNYIATKEYIFSVFIIRINDIILKFQIWDLCGQETYRPTAKRLSRNANLAILVYAIDE